MSTQIFTFTPGFVYQEKIDKNTLISNYENGAEQRRIKWPSGYGKRSFSMGGKALSQSQMEYVRDFFNARDGRYDSFYWKNPNENPISGEIITSNYQQEDTNQLVYFPIVADSQTIKDDGTPLVEGTDYSIDDTTGIITWLIKPASGSVITADYQFYRVLRFREDSLKIDRIAYQIYNVSFEVIEIEVKK